MDALVARAWMIWLSLHPSPASETSAFNKIRAFSRRCAGLLPFRISVSSSERSPQLNRTTYFFTTISFAAMIASVARVATKAYHQILSTSLKRATRGADPDSLSEGHLHRSTGDFEEALIALLGKDAGGLSASTIGRLKGAWSDEHTRWSKRDLSAKRYVYFWVDGIHVQARLEEAAQCLLVIIGASPEGKKELVGLIDGVRESAQSWKELLLGPQTAGSCDGTLARGRRRCPRLLASGRGGVAEDARPALLGAQDRQCLEQAAQEPAIEGQACAPGDLEGGDQEGRTRRVRRLHRNLGRQLRQGCRVPDQGSRRVACLLRLPG